MKSKLIYKLDNTVQEYAWGSKTSFSDLLGMSNPEGKPMAEIWMGAHPKAPSLTEDGPLNEVIAADSGAFLGPAVSDRFEGKLPFLFKVLAAGAPLSIQSHPSLDQAKEGFARENEAGIDLGAYERNYKDPNHKPEILCALTPFTAMWGFRAPADIRAEFEALKTEAAAQVLKALEAGDEKEALKGVLKTVMEMDKEALAPLLEKAQSAAPARGDVPGKWISRFAELYPGDPGILSPLYLNILELKPGEAIYVPAGELHAYLDGTGMELMANSDNVLRGGLTPKHVDVPELMSVLTFSPRTPELVVSSEAAGVISYPTPASEFLFSRLDIDGALSLDNNSARILIALDGETVCTAGAEGMESKPLTLKKGESLFLSAAASQLRLEGRGILYSAGIPAVTEGV